MGSIICESSQGRNTARVNRWLGAIDKQGGEEYAEKLAYENVSTEGTLPAIFISL